MVPDFDACVVPVGVEVLGIEDLAAWLFGAAEDHRVPEGRSGLLVDVDSGEDVAGGGKCTCQWARSSMIWAAAGASSRLGIFRVVVTRKIAHNRPVICGRS